MNTRSFFFLLLVLVLSASAVTAQDIPREEQTPPVENTIEEDFKATHPDIKAIADSVAAGKQDTVGMKVFMPDPKKALWFSIVPGLGQIYNRKYWKLPIVYGGLMGCTYAVTWNNRTYKDYMSAYKEFMDLKQQEEDEIPPDPNAPNPLWWNYVPAGVDPESVKGQMESYLKSNKDSYRRYRDLSIIATVAVYLLSVLDAYVDAQLYDFDISPDLGMRIEPAVFDRTHGNSQAYGLQCNIKF